MRVRQASAPTRCRRVMVAAAALSALLLGGCAPAVRTWTAGATTPVTRDSAMSTPTVAATPSATPSRAPAATATPSPRSGATPAPEPPPATADPPGGATAIGDSVMLGAAPALRSAIPSIEVDAVVSRQWDPGVATVDADRGSGRLRPTLIVDLGTNGTVSASQFDAMVRAASGSRRIVFVTVRVPRPWEAQDNAVLHAGVAHHPNAVLVDWYAASAGHGEWFAADGYHLRPAGARAFASLIAAAV